jgi:DNA invertase Pin-like site-specific DNA recombinase
MGLMPDGTGQHREESGNGAHPVDALRRAGVAPEDVYLDIASGAKSSRPQLDVVLKVVRGGDQLVITRLDRLGRSVLHLVTLGAQLRERGVGLRVLEQGIDIDTATAEGRAMSGMLSVLSELQRELIVANTRDGLTAARARSRTGGLKPTLTGDQVRAAQRMYDKSEHTVAQIADILNVKRGTLYGHLDKASLGGRPPAATTTAPPTSTTLTTPSAGNPPLADPPPRPVRAHIHRPGEPITPPEQHLVGQPAARPDSACPTCGHEPIEAQTRWQQRQDLATIWLHLDGDTTHEQRHCVACQPYDPPLNIECDRCGDSPLITGPPPNTPIGQRPPTLTRWLHTNGWRTDPEPRCDNHR